MDAEEKAHFFQKISTLKKKTPGSKIWAKFSLEGKNFPKMRPSQCGIVTTFDNIETENIGELFEEKEILENPSSQRERGILKIQIIDNGIGLTQTGINKLFKPFVQAESTTSQ